MSDDPRIERIETKIDRLNEKMEGISQRILVMETEEQMKNHIQKIRLQTRMQWISIFSVLIISISALMKYRVF